MDFDKWSIEKKKEFLKSFRHKSFDQIYNAFKKEGLEIHKAADGDDFFMITPNGYQYYFAVKNLKDKLSPMQKKLKAKYMHRYYLIVKD